MPVPPVEVKTAAFPGHCNVTVPADPAVMLAGDAISVALAQLVDNAGGVTVTDGTVWMKSTA